MAEENNQDAEYLSGEGFERLKKELSSLKEDRRKEIAERLEYAKSLGDLSENAEYEEAKEEQLTCEARISELEDILSRAVLISQPSSTPEYVDLGSTVRTQKDGSLEEDFFAIVGPHEADPRSNRISNESPLGKALMGKKKGDRIAVATPKGEIYYNIIDIS